MITIEKSALKVAKEKQAEFVVNVVKTPVCCSIGAINTVSADLCRKFQDPNQKYSPYSFEGVNIYVSNELEVKEKASIYKRAGIPGLGHFFGVRGIIPKQRDI